MLIATPTTSYATSDIQRQSATPARRGAGKAGTPPGLSLGRIKSRMRTISPGGSQRLVSGGRLVRVVSRLPDRDRTGETTAQTIRDSSVLVDKTSEPRRDDWEGDKEDECEMHRSGGSSSRPLLSDSLRTQRRRAEHTVRFGAAIPLRPIDEGTRMVVRDFNEEKERINRTLTQRNGSRLILQMDWTRDSRRLLVHRCYQIMEAHTRSAPDQGMSRASYLP
jgi:hypothetical protein